MIKGMRELEKSIKGVDKKIDQVIQVTLSQYANLIYSEAMSKLGNSVIASTFRIESSKDEKGHKVTIYTDNEIAAYIEFGTGEFALNYLNGQPDEVKDEAIKFFVNGEGKMPAKPYLFPVYYKYKEEIGIEINKRVQKVLDRV